MALFFTLGWFSGWDVAFDLVSLLVALLIAAYSWKMYRLSDENRFGYFSFAFLLISFAFLMKVLLSGATYFTTVRSIADIVLRPAVGAQRQYSFLFYRAGFFLQTAPMLAAWLLIFFVSQKKSGRLKKYYEISQIALFVYLILLISVVSNFEFTVFYLTSSVILGMTVLNYFKNYLNTNKNTNAFWVMIAFLVILFANFTFIFVFLQPALYALGEALMLLGFLVLLYTYSQITRG